MPGAALVALTLATTLAGAPPPPAGTPVPGPPAAPPPVAAPPTAPAPVASPPATAPVTAPPSTTAPAPAPLAYPVGNVNTAAAAAIPPGLEGEAHRYRRLQDATGLDLQGVWNDYVGRQRGESFYDFTLSRYRRRLAAGIGLALTGLVLTGAGMAMVLVAADKGTDAAEIDVIGGALVMTAGFCLIIPGAVLWPTSQVRLGKLRRAAPAIAARPGLRALGPVMVPRGAGLGFRLAF